MRGWWKVAAIIAVWLALGLAARCGCVKKTPGGSGPNPWYGD